MISYSIVETNRNPVLQEMLETPEVNGILVIMTFDYLSKEDEYQITNWIHAYADDQVIKFNGTRQMILELNDNQLALLKLVFHTS